MDPLLFADHLRRIRRGRDDAPATPPSFDLAGAGRLMGAACAACLLLVMLQVAISAPASLPGLQFAAQAGEEAVR